MVIHSIPVVVLASLSLLVGLYFLSIYWRNRNFQVSGSFALVCFAIVIYDIGCTGLYNATDFTTSAQWQRLQFAGIAATTAALTLFYHKLSGKYGGKKVTLIAIINLLFCVVGYTVRNSWTLTPEITADKFIEIAGIIHVHYKEARPGIIYNIQVLFSLAVFTVYNIGFIRYLRKSGGESIAMVAAMIVFYIAALNDALVGMGIYPFLYLFEYAFTGLIISMAAMLVNDFLDLVEKFEAVNRQLEAAVSEKTNELNVLSGLLPICASCKKIRDDKGYWNQIETYLKDHSNATFSHGICPECQERLYPELSRQRPKDSIKSEQK